MIKFFYSILIAIVLFSFAIAEENNEFSLLVTSENDSARIHVSGFIPNSILAKQFSLNVTENNGVYINSNYDIPIQSISEFFVKVEPHYSYTFKMTAYDEFGKALLVSETIKNISLGQFSQNFIFPNKLSSTEKKLQYRVSSNGLAGQIDESTCDSFPIISLSAQVTRNSNVLETLKENNFSVLEDGLSPSNNITVIPPKSGQSVRAADFAIVFDHSGSMDNKLRSLRASIGNFVDALKASDISFNLAFVPYEHSPTIEQDMTADPQQFLDSVDNFLAHWPSGRTENAFKAMQTSVNSLAWRPGAQKIILLFTDEDDDNGGTNLQGINQILTESNTTVYGIVNQNSGHSNRDFCAPGSVTSATGGRCYNIASPSYTDILGDITTTIGQNYIIRYKTSNLDSSSGNRSIELKIADAGDTVTASSTYDPFHCAGMNITLAASNTTTEKAHRQYQSIPVVAFVRSADPNLQPTVTLYYRHHGDTSYDSIEMNELTTSTFRGFIAKERVVDPGVEFYIKAENGRQTVTLPSVNAVDNPFSISVLPNKAPVITHNVKSSIPSGKNLLVKADVVDDTTKVAEVKVHYLSFEGGKFYSTVNMVNTSGDTYEVVIPSENIKGTAIYYYIEAIDDFGVTTTSGRIYFPHRTFISTVGYGDSCLVPTGGLLIFCGDKIDTAGSIYTISGNVTIQGRHTYQGTDTIPASDNQPQLSVESAIEVDIDKQTVKTKGSGEVRALQYRRASTYSPEDFVLFEGALEGNFNGDFVPTRIDALKFGLFGTNNLQWGTSKDIKITLRENGQLWISGALFVVGNEFSAFLTPLKIPKKIVLDPKGNETDALIEIRFKDINTPIKFVHGFVVKDYLIGIDFLRGKINIGGTVASATKNKKILPVVGKLNVTKVEAKLGIRAFYDSPYIDSFSIEPKLREPSLQHPNVWSIPQSPPSPLGIAPTSGVFGMKNISGDWSVIPPMYLTLSGSLVDTLGINQAIKFGIGKWLLNGSVTGTLDTATESFTLTGDMRFLEAFNLARAKLSIINNNQIFGLELLAAINLPSRSLDYLSGSIKQKFYASNGLLSSTGEQQLQVKIPDDFPIVGGFNRQIKVSETVVAKGNQLEKFEFGWVFDILWFEASGRYDLVSGKLSPRKTYTGISSMSRTYDNGELKIGGYQNVVTYRKSAKRNQANKPSKVTAVVPTGNVVLIRVESDKSSALFDLVTPTGEVYKLEDATFDPNAPLASKAMFRNNLAAKEGYWALKSPQAGVYELRFRNETELGSYSIEVLKQNTKPEIKITTITSDVNASPGDKVTISWDADDPDDDADIRLYFDTDNIGNDGGIIATGIKENSSTNSFEWTIPDNMHGSFYVYAVIDDGNLGAVTNYSLGRIILPDAIVPSTPSNLVANAGDGSVSMSWSLNNAVEDVAAYRIYIKESVNQKENHINVYSNVNKYVFSNLGNGVTYEVALSAIDEAGAESIKTPWQVVNPTGLSSDGPPDLYVPQENIVATLDGSVVKVSVNVENISAYNAYSYTLSCWVGTQDSEHLIGEVKGKNLAGKSVVTHNLQFDALVFPKPIGETIICRISNVSIEELNTVNNGMVNTQALRGLLNASPIAVADSATTLKDTAITTANLLANDTDVDNDTLSVSTADATSTEGGTVINHNNGTFTFTPKAGFTGTDTFTYTVSDGNGGSATGTVTITVNAPANKAPVAVTDTATTLKDIAVTTGNVLANDTDADNDTLSVSAADATSTEGGAVVNHNNGTFTFTPKAGFTGTDTFTYTVSDGNGGSAIGTVTITINAPFIIGGDANGDGNINSLDLVKLINHILQVQSANGNPDCNGDGSVNSLDVVCLINKILGTGV